MSFFKTRTRKIIRYSFLTFFIVILSAGTYIYVNLDKIVNARLKKVLTEKFGSFYTLTFDTIEKDISLSNLSFKVSNARFNSDTTDIEGIEKFPIIFFDTKTLTIKNINTFDVLWGSNIDLAEISLDSTNFTFYKREIKIKSDATNKHGKSFLNTVSLDLIKLEQGEFEIFDFDTKEQLFHGDSLLLELSELEVDLTKMDDFRNSFKYHDIKFESKNAKYSPLKGIYKYTMGGLNISDSQQYIQLKHINITTKESLYEASKSTVNQKEIFNLEIEKLLFSGFDIHRLVYENEVEIDKLNIEDAEINVFKNKLRKLDDTFEKKVFGEIINSIKIPIIIDTIILSEVDIYFELLNNSKAAAGEIEFNIFEGVISNFTTMGSIADTLNISIKGQLMNKGAIHFNTSIAVYDTVNYHQSFSGSLINIPITVFNPLIRSLANVQMKSGNIRRVDFKGTNNRTESKGQVTFLYSDLKLSIYDVSRKNKSRRDIFLSGASNMAVHKSNPSKKGIIRTSHFLFKREKWQGNVMLWLGGILDGMLKTTMKDFTEKLVDKKKDKMK